MPPRKRPSATEQEPLKIEGPRKQGPSTPQREERRAEWKTQRRQTKRKLLAHFQLRAGVHSQLCVIASRVLRIFLTCLVGYPTPGFRSAPTPPAVHRTLHPYPHSPCVPLPSQPAWTWTESLRLRLSRSLSQSLSLPQHHPRSPPSTPQAPRSSQAATQAAASEPGPSTPLPAKRSKRTKAESEAAEPSQPTKGKGKAQGKAAKAKPAPQPGRWVDRDCNAALNMQRIGKSKWRPLQLCFWPEQGKLPAKGKEYPGLGYKRLRDKPPKAQQQQPVVAQ